jgi:hypothetical protein
LDIEALRKEKGLVGVYRDAFGWEGGSISPTMEHIMADLEVFCGHRQARFNGTECEMVKQLGRSEVLGRIKYFLNYPDKELSVLNKAINHIEAEKENDDG